MAKKLIREGKNNHLDIRLDPANIPNDITIYGLDLAKWNTGFVEVNGNLETGDLKVVNWQLIQIDPKHKALKGIPKSQQYPIIADLVMKNLDQLNLRLYLRFIAFETVFMGKNAGSMIDTAMIRGAVAHYLFDWYVSGQAFDIAPTLMKQRAMAKPINPFASGGGLAKKHMIADAMIERFGLTTSQFYDMTTIEKPRTVKTVYDVTDAQALAYALFVELRHHKGYI